MTADLHRVDAAVGHSDVHQGDAGAADVLHAVGESQKRQKVAMNHYSDHLMGVALVEPLHVLQRLARRQGIVPGQGHAVVRARVLQDTVRKAVRPLCRLATFVGNISLSKVLYRSSPSLS